MPLNYCCELKTLPTDDGEFLGYAAVFNVVDAVGDVFLPGAFARSLSEKGPKGVPMLWQHGRVGVGKTCLDPCGEWFVLREDEKGLFVRGQLFLNVSQGKERLLLLQKRAVTGLSIGYDVPPGGATFDPKTGVRVLREIDLYEISPVTFGVSPGAVIADVVRTRRPRAAA